MRDALTHSIKLGGIEAVEKLTKSQMQTITGMTKI